MNSGIVNNKETRAVIINNEIIKKWRHEIEQIQLEVSALYHSRSVYKRLVDIVDANPNIQQPNAFYDWLQSCYIVDASTTIRRLLDFHEDTVSLANLANNIKANSHIISRKWYVSQHKLRNANKEFDLHVGEGRDCIDSDDLNSRLEDVRNASGLVKDYVDKLVAHTDKKVPDKLPTFNDLDNAIDAIGIFFKYLHILLNQGSAILEPVEEYRWEKLFREPWIIPSEA